MNREFQLSITSDMSTAVHYFFTAQAALHHLHETMKKVTVVNARLVWEGTGIVLYYGTSR